MEKIKVSKSTLRGAVTAPPSKSHSLRAILFAALAKGKSHIKNILSSPDVDAMMRACRQFGAHVESNAADELVIHGVAGVLQVMDGETIDAGNSGQVLRYLTAVMATQSVEVTVTGDESICSNRPIYPYINSFKQLGVSCSSIKGNGYAPVRIKGPFRSREITVDGQDSQTVTGLCIAATLGDGETVINVNDPGETPWLDLTLSWLHRVGVPVRRDGYTQFVISGKTIDAFDYTVPGDFSSVAFPVAAGIVTRSPVVIEGIDWQDAQGDKQLFYALLAAGVSLDLDNEKGVIGINRSSAMQACQLDINDYIDALTILAVLATQAQGTVEIVNAAIAREKESDRVAAIASELSKMGANIDVREDGLLVYPSDLQGAVVESFGDHRMVMSLAVAGLIAEGETLINNTACVRKSYRSFVKDMQKLGAKMEVLT